MTNGAEHTDPPVRPLLLAGRSARKELKPTMSNDTVSPKTLIGLHIPKCAGSSFFEMAATLLSASEVHQTSSFMRNLKEYRPQFHDIPDYSALRLVWGHNTHEEMLYRFEKPFLFTGLRKPADRLLSNYLFDVRMAKMQDREIPAPDLWFGAQKDPMCSFIVQRFPRLSGWEHGDDLYPAAKRVLECFDFVYFAERFAIGAETLFALLGIRPMVRTENVGDSDHLDFWIDPSTYQGDENLYNWAAKHFGDGLVKRSQLLDEFLEQGPVPDALDDFLYTEQAREYRAWGALDEVITDKLSTARRLIAEASHYTSVRNFV
jgi:hypothetical protein